jgi:hypothetical protein
MSIKAIKLAIEWIEKQPEEITASKYDVNTRYAVLKELEAALTQEQSEPLEYWNAVEGWVKLDEVREHFDSVSCGTIYKSGGEGRVPLCLAQPKQEQVEPVAWMSEENECIFFDADKPNPMDYDFWTPLYTTPQQRTWVGLIPEEIDGIIEDSIDKVDALIQTMDKLKEKNT